MSDQPFDEAFWANALGLSSQEPFEAIAGPGEPSCQTSLVIESQLIEQARRLITALAHDALTNAVGLPIEAADIYARAERAVSLLTRLLFAASLNVLEWPSHQAFLADLDAATVFVQTELGPTMFAQADQIPVDAYRAYGHVLLIGLRLGAFWATTAQ